MYKRQVLTGWLAEVFDPSITAVIMGGIAVVWAAVWMWLTTDVRRATMLEGCGGPPPDAYEAPGAPVLAD